MHIRIRIKGKKIDQNLTNKSNFQPFKQAFVPKQVCFMAYHIQKNIVQVKLQPFVTAKFDHKAEQDPH
jgi:hypothetical protein